MPSDLLKCTICPKKPIFSDVSHLLTHVGSKGHLANLHGLQVRSHQELDAGRQLVIYNQWFQEHGVASLLSERMLQKQQKRAVKKDAIKEEVEDAGVSTAHIPGKPRARKAGKNVPKVPAISAYEAQPPNLKTRMSDNDFNDIGPTSVGEIDHSRHSSYPTLPSSPPQAITRATKVEDHELIEEDEPEVKASPGTPQLKGTRYPGMDLFDAASEEQRKKRNQKKDSSVLRQLERNASMVEPRETVTSAAGLLLKHRHMDNLENDEPVEGEEPIRIPTPKRRKTSAPRRPRVKAAAKKTNKDRKRSQRVIETPSKVPSQSAADVTESGSRFSPTEDESREFKLAVQPIERKKRKKNFIVYEDSSPAFGGDGASESIHPTSVNASMNQTQPEQALPFWHIDQNEIYDPFKLIRERFTSYATFGGIFRDKENVPLLNPHASSAEHVNPLFFQGHDDDVVLHRSSTTANRLNSVVVSETDPFLDSSFIPMRNPLMAAFEALQSPTKQESFDYGGVETTTFSGHHRQPLFAPQ